MARKTTLQASVAQAAMLTLEAHKADLVTALGTAVTKLTRKPAPRVVAWDVAEPAPAKTKRRPARRIGKAQPMRVVLASMAHCGIRYGTDRYAKLQMVFSAQPTDTREVLGKEYAPGKRLSTGDIAGMVRRGHVVLD